MDNCYINLGAVKAKEIDGELYISCWNFSKALAEKEREISDLCKENDELEKKISELEEKLGTKQETKLPSLPIDVASILINATIKYPTISLLKAFGAGETSIADKYSKSDLREIAEHLLIYCNASDENSNTQS